MQIRLGDHTFDLRRAPDSGAGPALLLDGKPLDARFERLDGRTYLLVLDGHPHVVTLEPVPGPDPASGTAAGHRLRTTTRSHVLEATAKGDTALLLERFGFESGGGETERAVRAPMPGLVLTVLVAPGQAVEEGQGIVVLEAMKMENELRAPAAGTVAAVHVAPGATVGKGTLLVEIGAG